MLLELLLLLLVVLAQVLSYFGVAMLVVGDNNLAVLGGRDTRLAVELARQIALPVLLVFAHVLNAEGVTVVDEQRFAALAQHELELALAPLIAGRH